MKYHEICPVNPLNFHPRVEDAAGEGVYTAEFCIYCLRKRGDDLAQELADVRHEAQFDDPKKSDGATRPGSTRIRPEELTALARAMRECGVHDLATGDTRILISPAAFNLPGTMMPPGENEGALRSLVNNGPTMADAEDDEDMLHASVTG